MPEATEFFRRGLVGAMKHGKHFVVSIEAMIPDFTDQVMKGESDQISVDLVLNHEEFWKDEVNKKIVLEDENTNMMGNKG